MIPSPVSANARPRALKRDAQPFAHVRSCGKIGVRGSKYLPMSSQLRSLIRSYVQLADMYRRDIKRHIEYSLIHKPRNRPTQPNRPPRPFAIIDIRSLEFDLPSHIPNYQHQSHIHTHTHTHALHHFTLTLIHTSSPLTNPTISSIIKC